ncbi:U11/U12 small nuclear ribonucleoprotein 25 kDa protein isoform X2 [Solanum pennellii]|uniref:U11/U12 small nuclear ribonucleoprotein 25 kDa protein isoform X2 n=1 Tax=Solanum pennellii TaxID=28526 RepID=A0ABM1FHJ2_SOLPN|nr:U11/U12 small nuclear ribonucleoprotein 25 kDa protein isoform X2 [Solanum pennellii]
MGHHETNSSSSRDRSPSQQRHRHRRKERDLDRELSYEKRERRSGRDVIEHRSPRPRHDYSFSGSDHQRMAHQRPSSNFSVDTERKNEVFDPTGSEKRKDRDVSMDKTKADEQDLEAKKEQMTLLEMSGDLTTEPKQLTEGRKEETNVSLEYSSDMKKARLHSTLVALLNDPVLADIPKNPTLTDVDTLISLELGSAMRISVLKLDGSSFDVTVMNSATVKDLKQAVRKRIDDTEQSKMGHRHISWRHVWSNFCLLFHNEKLLDDTAKLQDYSIRNNAQVQFVPYVISRAFKRHSKRRKHRFFHGLSKKGRTTD